MKMKSKGNTVLKYGWFYMLLISANFSCSEEKEPSISVPAPVLKINNATVSEIDIEWSVIEDAVAYEIDVALDINFENILSDYDAVREENSQLLVENLKPSTTYFIRVRAVDLDGRISENSNVVETSTAEYKVCESSSNYQFKEKEGIIKVEFEDAEFGPGWELEVGNEKTSGIGYMVWTGSDFFSKPSNDLVSYELNISTPGTYSFIWNSAVTIGTSGTESNDTWLRFPDANDFYAKKGSEIVYPKGTGKTPNPEGASSDGWFKIYRSGNDLDFKWQARTSDSDPHEIYVEFSETKTYDMQISARSKGHGIDKFALHLESLNQSVATSADFSEIICL